MKTIGALLFLFAGAAAGQGRPTLVDYPLDVKTAVSDAVIGELQDDLRQQLARNPGVLVPTRSNWKAAVAALKRNDCEVRNECLQQLAVSAGVLYAMYLSLERNTTGDVTATGRVVNQDGLLVRPPESVKVANQATFQEAARDALTQLLTKLKLETLSPVLAKAPVEEPKGKETIVVMRETPAPSTGLRTGGFVTGALAVASAAVCAGFGISAMTTRGTLPANGHFTSEEQARAQTSVNQGATIALGTGLGAVALGATSIILFALSSPDAAPAPAPGPTLSLAPAPGGAHLMFSGRF